MGPMVYSNATLQRANYVWDASSAQHQVWRGAGLSPRPALRAPPPATCQAVCWAAQLGQQCTLGDQAGRRSGLADRQGPGAACAMWHGVGGTGRQLLPCSAPSAGPPHCACRAGCAKLPTPCWPAPGCAAPGTSAWAPWGGLPLSRTRPTPTSLPSWASTRTRLRRPGGWWAVGAGGGLWVAGGGRWVVGGGWWVEGGGL